jgi:hypothetical protein
MTKKSKKLPNIEQEVIDSPEYAAGHADGHAAGFEEGFKAGHAEGFDDGLAEEHEAGHADGLDEGRRSGIYRNCRFLATSGFLDAAKSLCKREFPTIDTESSLWLAVLCEKCGYYEKAVMMDPVGWYRENCYNK